MREVLMRSTEPTTVRKIFVVELYLRKIFSYIFCVRNIFKANYGSTQLSLEPEHFYTKLSDLCVRHLKGLVHVAVA